MTLNAIRITILTTVALLGFLAVLLVAGVTAQSPGEGGTPTFTPTPSATTTAKLKASRTVVGIGNTTDITVYDVVPKGAVVRLVVGGTLRHGSCEAEANSADWSFPIVFEPPVTFTLTACGPVGSATVKLETMDGVELASLSVSVQQTTPPSESVMQTLFPSATSTPRASEWPDDSTGSSELPLPPAPSNLVMRVSNKADLLIQIDPMSDIKKLEAGLRVKYQTDTVWRSWMYQGLPATWVSNNTAKNLKCGSYQAKFRARGDGITYRDAWGPWSATGTATIYWCPPPTPKNITAT